MEKALAAFVVLCLVIAVARHEVQIWRINRNSSQSLRKATKKSPDRSRGKFTDVPRTEPETEIEYGGPKLP